jgi:nucleotide-binding universal stress UspA family protein
MSGAYNHIAVASTFSPRFRAVLAEADRIARRLDSPLSVIHAAAEHEEAIARFFEALQDLDRAGSTGVLWSVAESPIEAILSACRRNEIDLLMAGALEREGEHRNFVGGVARGLLHNMPCDLLLLPNPAEEPKARSKMVVDVNLQDPSIPYLNRACEIASRLGIQEMVFTGIVTPFDEARVSRSGERLDEEKLAAILDQADGFHGDIDFRLLRSNTGFSVCDFLQDSGADFFVAGVRETDNQRRLPARLDWLLQVIPTNVLLLGVDGTEAFPSQQGIV